MKIENLLEGIKVISSDIKKDEEVKIIEIDSRKVEPGFAFICFEGTKSDGHLYVKDAVKNGATFIIIQKDIEPIEGVNIIKIESGRATVGQIACNFYKNPSKEFK
jgi:UDP-N-acetylmuramoyl-L-alanyl-D-glutamate--2,6-diaminopimelate ligase